MTWARSGWQIVVVSFIATFSGVSIFIGVVVFSGIVRSSSASSAASAVDCVVGCVSWGWEAMTGGSRSGVFTSVSEFAVIGIFIGFVGGSIIVVVVVVIARKLSSAASALSVVVCGSC